VTTVPRRSISVLQLVALLGGPTAAACDGAAPTGDTSPPLQPLRVTASALRADSAVIAGRIPADARAVFSGVGALDIALPGALDGLPALEPINPLFAADSGGYFIPIDRMSYRYSWRPIGGWVFGPFSAVQARAAELSLHGIGSAGALGDSIGTVIVHDSTGAGSTRLVTRWFTDRDSAQADIRTVGSVGAVGTIISLRTIVGRFPHYAVLASEELTNDATGSRGFTSSQWTLEPANGFDYVVEWTVSRSSTLVAVHVVVSRKAPPIPVSTFVADFSDNTPGAVGGDTTRVSVDGRSLGFFANGGRSLQQSTHPDGSEVALAYFGLVGAMLPPGGALLFLSEQLARIRSATLLPP